MKAHRQNSLIQTQKKKPTRNSEEKKKTSSCARESRDEYITLGTAIRFPRNEYLRVQMHTTRIPTYINIIIINKHVITDRAVKPHNAFIVMAYTIFVFTNI